jgi:hypothetical protein
MDRKPGIQPNKQKTIDMAEMQLRFTLVLKSEANNPRISLSRSVIRLQD